MRTIVALAILALTALPAQAQDRLVVLLDWFVNPDHAALIVARDSGFFEKHGLEVELIAPADPSDPPKLVAAKQADLAISYQTHLHLMADEGLPLMRIGTLVDSPLNSLVVLEDGPIQSIADLKGRRIGFSVGGFEGVLLGAMLQNEGLTIDDVELINVNWSLSPSLIAGQVDAVIGAFRNFELNQLDIEGEPGRAFFPEAHGVPNYDELIVIAHIDNAETDDRFPRFLAALREATAEIVLNSDKYWEVFLASNPDELGTELYTRAWVDTIPLLAREPHVLNAKQYYAFGDFLKGAGLIETTPPLHTYATELQIPCDC